MTTEPMEQDPGVVGVPPEEDAKDPEQAPTAPGGGKVPAAGEGPTNTGGIDT